MSNIQEPQKTVEVKMRYRTNDRSDQKDMSRVNVPLKIMQDLQLKSGQSLYIWRKEEGFETRKEGIAWPAGKDVTNLSVQATKMFLEITNFKTTDNLIIAAGPPLETAESVVLREITPEIAGEKVPDIAKEVDKWVWLLEGHLSQAEIVLGGMNFNNVDAFGQVPKRTFIVDFVDNRPTGQAKFKRGATSVEIWKGSHNLPKLELVNIAGLDQSLRKLNDFLGVSDRLLAAHKRSCSTIIHGGSGSGKTHLLEKITEIGWGRTYRINQKMKPETIEKVFQNAQAPSIIVIDDLEILVSGSDQISKEITEIIGDGLRNLAKRQPRTLSQVVWVIAATRDLSKIPSALRYVDRFEEDIMLSMPDAAARKALLESMELKVRPEIKESTIEKLGDATHAYTANDLDKLLRKAYKIADSKLDPEKELLLEQEDFEEAQLAVRPTAMHDVTLQPPKVRWDEVGGQENVKLALRKAVERPLLHPERVKRVGVSAKKGILLYGPPGCSKTLTAQALATESKFNFFAVKGAELLNMYVGQSEKAVRDIFAKARAASPSIIFFDEIDAIGGKREGGRSNGVNVLTTLLNEMDGIEALKGVMVLAATNSPHTLDDALLRPGRFDTKIYAGLPDLAGREAILRVKQRKMDFVDVDIPLLASKTAGYTGAEMVSICEVAGDICLDKCEEEMDDKRPVRMVDFEQAMNQVMPQISPEKVEWYEKWGSGENVQAE